MKHLISKTSFWINVGAVSISGLMIASVAFGWTNPIVTPPEGSGAIRADDLGNVGIGIDASGGYKLNVAGKSRGTELCIGTDCRSEWPSGVSGSGTSGKLAKFTGATSIGNSVITETTGGNIGIGVSSPTKKFEVSGGVKATEFCIGTYCFTNWPLDYTASPAPVLNKIVKFTDVSTGTKKIGNSIISDDGSTVEVAGKIKTSGPSLGVCIGSDCRAVWPADASHVDCYAGAVAGQIMCAATGVDVVYSFVVGSSATPTTHAVSGVRPSSNLDCDSAVSGTVQCAVTATGKAYSFTAGSSGAPKTHTAAGVKPTSDIFCDSALSGVVECAVTGNGAMYSFAMGSSIAPKSHSTPGVKSE